MPSIKSLNKLDNTPITKVQFETLEYIAWFVGRYGYAPSLEEMANYFKKSKSSIFERIERLKRKQLLNKWIYQKRGMDLADSWDKRIEMKEWFDFKNYEPKKQGLLNRIFGLK